MNTLWLITAIATPTLWATSNVFDGAMRKHFVKDDLTLTWMGGLLRLPLILFFLFSGSFRLPANLGDLGMIFLAGILWVFPIVLYFRALEKEETSRVVLMMQFLPVITLALAYPILGEVLTGIQLIAFVILLVGSTLASIKKTKKGHPWHLNQALIFVFFAAFMWGMSDVVFKKYELGFNDYESAFAF